MKDKNEKKIPVSICSFAAFCTGIVSEITKGVKIMEKIVKFLEFVVENPIDIWLYVLISCCAGIFLTGAVKGVAIKKIQNESIRASLSYFCGIFFTVLSAVVYIYIEETMNFDLLAASTVVLVPAEVFLYSLYEYTWLRKAIHWIGETFYRKVIVGGAQAIVFGKDSNDLKESIAEVKNEVKAKIGTDLKNL